VDDLVPYVAAAAASLPTVSQALQTAKAYIELRTAIAKQPTHVADLPSVSLDEAARAGLLNNYLAEAEGITASRTELHKELVRSPKKAATIRKQQSQLDEEERVLLAKIGALHWIEQEPPQRPPSGMGLEEAVSTHWMVTFEAQARLRQETWRAQLLERALAQQGSFPGSVSLKALWMIGTHEKRAFNALAGFIDTAVSVSVRPAGLRFLVIDGHVRPLQSGQPQKIACGDERLTLDQIYAVLEGENLIRPLMEAESSPYGHVVVGYGDSFRQYYWARPNPFLQHSNRARYTLQDAGKELALLHCPKTNSVGLELWKRRDHWALTATGLDAPLTEIVEGRIKQAKTELDAGKWTTVEQFLRMGRDALAVCGLSSADKNRYDIRIASLSARREQMRQDAPPEEEKPAGPLRKRPAPKRR